MLQLSRVGLRIYVTGVRGQKNAKLWIDAPSADIRTSCKMLTLGELLALKETARAALRQYAGGVEPKSFNDVASLCLPKA